MCTICLSGPCQSSPQTLLWVTEEHMSACNETLYFEPFNIDTCYNVSAFAFTLAIGVQF